MNLPDLPERIVIFDTEYTSWEGAQDRNWSGLGEYKEIVQIGAIMLDTKTFDELSSFEELVKPAKNFVLSDYFIDLTGISQEDIDNNGVSLNNAVEKFYKWSEGLPFYSYGFDGKVLEENCELLGISFPFKSERFFDVRETFQEAGIDTSSYMSSTIPEAFGKNPPRDAHNALSDSRSIAIALKAMNDKNTGE